MSVYVTYVGVDGKETSFASESAADAVARLGKVGGFNRTPADAVAEKAALEICGRTGAK